MRVNRSQSRFGLTAVAAPLKCVLLSPVEAHDALSKKQLRALRTGTRQVLVAHDVKFPDPLTTVIDELGVRRVELECSSSRVNVMVNEIISTGKKLPSSPYCIVRAMKESGIVMKSIPMVAEPTGYSARGEWIAGFKEDSRLVTSWGPAVFADETLTFFQDDGGPDLFEKLSKSAKNSLKLEEIVKLVNEMAHIHSELEKRMIVHRDVKPENVLVGDLQNFDIRLIDFNHAVAQGETTNHVTGTVGYKAPEMANGSLRQETCQSDMFSTGIMLLVCTGMDVGSAQPWPESPSDASIHAQAISAAAGRRLKKLQEGDFRKTIEQFEDLVIQLLRQDPACRLKPAELADKGRELTKTFEAENRRNKRSLIGDLKTLRLHTDATSF